MVGDTSVTGVDVDIRSKMPNAKLIKLMVLFSVSPFLFQIHVSESALGATKNCCYRTKV